MVKVGDHITLDFLGVKKEYSAKFYEDVIYKIAKAAKVGVVNISKKELNIYPANSKFDFIISSIAKNCGHSQLDKNYECNYYKPLISNNLIN